jgi:signal transduction histidine kinase
MAMSHELRTPLNAIGGYAELLQLGITGPVTPAQVEQLDRIRRAQKHLLRIITDLLDFSRMNAAQLEYDIRRFTLSDALESVTQMISPLAQRNGIALVCRGGHGHLEATADRTKVEQILLNLLSNAIKFTPRGGEVSIECAPLGPRVVAIVRDSGIGIGEEMIEAVFQPFVQVGRSLTSGHEGSGLGLAISRDLARAMDGELTVESTVNQGSVFTLSLPGVAA